MEEGSLNAVVIFNEIKAQRYTGTLCVCYGASYSRTLYVLQYLFIIGILNSGCDVIRVYGFLGTIKSSNHLRK